jgi:hypothetical protein
MDQSKFSIDPRHVGAPLVVPKMISEPMVCSAQTVHLTCIMINTISKQTKWSSLDLRHLGVPSSVPKRIRAYVELTQIMHLSCVEFNTISK